MTAVPKGSKSIEEKFDDLEARIGRLESSPRATRTTVTNGVFAIQDASGNLLCQFDQHGFIQFNPGTAEEMVRIGRLQTGPDRFGIRVRKSGTGTIIFQADDAGNQIPRQYLPWASFQFLSQTSSASFTDVFRMQFYSAANGVGYDFSVDPGGGGTMDWRIRIGELGASLVDLTSASGITTFTQVQNSTAIPVGALLSGTDPVGRFFDMRLEVRLTAGAGPTTTRLITPFANSKV